MGQLLIIGAGSVITKQHVHASGQPGTWPGDTVSRKPATPVRVALANKMARVVRGL